MPTAPPRHYYVRINAKVRGPFDVGRLVSMRGRGRLNPRDEVSLDRRQWVAAGTIAEVFPEGFAGTDRNPEALDWHYNCRGQQMGPVSLATLQSLAQGGQLAPTDSVWKLGTPGWILANQVPELTFPQPPETWWAKSSGATKAGILVAASILVMAPIGLVLANYWHTIDMAKQQIAQQLEQEKFRLDQQQRQEDKALQLQMERERNEAVATGQARQKAETNATVAAAEQRTNAAIAAAQQQTNAAIAAAGQRIEAAADSAAADAKAAANSAAAPRKVTKLLKCKSCGGSGKGFFSKTCGNCNGARVANYTVYE